MSIVADADAEAAASRARRDARYRQADFLLHHSSLRRVRVCGRLPIEREAPIEVCRGDGLAYFRNVQRCGSVHACPVCAPKIRHGRAAEIETGLGRLFDAGGSALFLTLTVRHHVGQDLASLLGGISDAFSGMLRGRAYQDDRADFGVVGTVRSLEVTHGENGWHPHLHVLVVLDRRLRARAIGKLRYRFAQRWVSQLRRVGLEASASSVGCRLDPVSRGSDGLARYLSKVFDERSVAMETTRGDLKVGRNGSRSPFGILADAAEYGDRSDLALWQEYERATKGRSLVRWSVGLRALLLPAADVSVSDEQPAEAEVGGDLVASVNLNAWRSLRLRRGARVELLRAAELHGEAGVYEALWRYSDGEVVPPAASTSRADLNLFARC